MKNTKPKKRYPKDKFLQELSCQGEKVQKYILESPYAKLLRPRDVFDGSLNYPSSIGKALRPSILLLSCGAVGGNRKKAMPAAAAVELYHTWTLVHDDIIDNDEIRRGGPTVHKQFYDISRKRGYSDEEAREYGRNIAIIVGDIQHSWSIWLFTELYKKHKIAPEIVLALIEDMEKRTSPLLLEGETLDVQYEKKKISELSVEKILDMSAKKTGELYAYAARAGAMIGLEISDTKDKLVLAVSNFCYNCGVAFQLQDDILGLIAKQEKFGKSIGSDIREGKRTTIIWYAYQNATKTEKKRIEKLLGKKNASEKEIKEAIELVRKLGGVEKTAILAKKYIKRAKKYLKSLPDSKHKTMLSLWADFMVTRNI